MSSKIEYLTSEGFPEPIIAYGGNGYHALYKLDLPNTKEVTQMIKYFLIVLDKKFSTDEAQIDKTTYNPSRITKLYGTIACKGDSSETRPHRRSRIIDVSKEFNVVEESLINKVAELIPKKEVKVKKQSNKTNVISSFDAKEWLEKREIEISHTEEKGK